jgi:hypothetical protein
MTLAAVVEIAVHSRLATPLNAGVFESVGRPRFDNGPISETI